MSDFTAAELALLRASDRVVDQQQPGGVLYHRDRAPVFTVLERRILEDADRAIDRVDARRVHRAPRVWRVPRRPVGIGGACPHGVAVSTACDDCPERGAA